MADSMGREGWEYGWMQRGAHAHSDEELAEAVGELKQQSADGEGRLSTQMAAQNALTAVSLTGGFKDTQIGFKESQGLNYQNTAQIVSTVNSRAAEQAVAAVGFAKDALIDSTKNAAAAALAASVNTAAILAAQAECCCELKEKIGAEGERTRALIDSIERQRLLSLVQRLQTVAPAGTVVVAG